MSQNTWIVYGTVVEVHDGDTFTADLDLGWGIWSHKKPVRVAGINAPELGPKSAPNPPGAAARVFAASLLPIGSRVRLESHHLDKYGRALCTVTLADGTNLSTAMVAAGHAVPFMVAGLLDVTSTISPP